MENLIEARTLLVFDQLVAVVNTPARAAHSGEHRTHRIKQILEYDGPVFGASAIECGHYENLSLDEAKKECRAYLKVLESQTNMEFTYPQ